MSIKEIMKKAGDFDDISLFDMIENMANAKKSDFNDLLADIPGPTPEQLPAQIDLAYEYVLRKKDPDSYNKQDMTPEKASFVTELLAN